MLLAGLLTVLAISHSAILPKQTSHIHTPILHEINTTAAIQGETKTDHPIEPNVHHVEPKKEHPVELNVHHPIEHLVHPHVEHIIHHLKTPKKEDIAELKGEHFNKTMVSTKAELIKDHLKDSKSHHHLISQNDAIAFDHFGVVMHVYRNEGREKKKELIHLGWEGKETVLIEGAKRPHFLSVSYDSSTIAFYHNHTLYVKHDGILSHRLLPTLKNLSLSPDGKTLVLEHPEHTEILSPADLHHVIYHLPCKQCDFDDRIKFGLCLCEGGVLTEVMLFKRKDTFKKLREFDVTALGGKPYTWIYEGRHALISTEEGHLCKLSGGKLDCHPSTQHGRIHLLGFDGKDDYVFKAKREAKDHYFEGNWGAKIFMELFGEENLVVSPDAKYLVRRKLQREGDHGSSTRIDLLKRH